MYGNDPFHARCLFEIGKSQPFLVLGPFAPPLRVRVYTRPSKNIFLYTHDTKVELKLTPIPLTSPPLSVVYL